MNAVKPIDPDRSAIILACCRAIIAAVPDSGISALDLLAALDARYGLSGSVAEIAAELGWTEHTIVRRGARWGKGYS